MPMLLKNIDLNFFPSLPLNYKFSADGQLCLPAGSKVYILSNSILNSDLVSNPPVPSKFRPGDENKLDYRKAENRVDSRAQDEGGSDNEDGSGSEYEDDGDEDDEQNEEGGDVEADVEDDKLRPEFQFHWQQLELDVEADGIQKGGVMFQLDQTFKEGCPRQLEWSPLGAGRYRRCCLAVLTTSRQILIYQPATVIGRGLKLSMRLLNKLIDQDIPGDDAVEITWDKLPREICWSHPCTFHTQRWGIPILTMIDEHNELKFVKVIDEDVETMLKVTLSLPEEDTRITGMTWSPWFIISPTEGIAFFTFKSSSGVYAQKMVLVKKDGKVNLSCGDEPTLITAGMLPGYVPHAIIWYERTYSTPEKQPEMLLAVVQHDGVDFFGISLNPRKELVIQRRVKVEYNIPSRLSGYAFSDPLWGNYLDLNISATNGQLAIVKVDLANFEKSMLFKAFNPTFSGRDFIFNDPEIDNPNIFKRDWIDTLDEKREAFIQEWKIVQATCHVYGMAYSPLGGILSVCYRLKPEGVLEYPIKERERCTLSWEICRSWYDMFDPAKAEGSVKPFTLFGVPGEAFLSDIRFLVSPEDAEESFGKMEEVIAKGMEESQKAQAVLESPNQKQFEPHRFADVPASELADALSISFYNSKEAILLRARNVLGLLKANKVAPKKPSVLLAQTGITKLILQGVLEIPIVKRSPLFVSSKQSILIIYLLASLGIISFYRDERIMRLAVLAIESIQKVFGLRMDAEADVIADRFAILKDPGNLDLLSNMKSKMERAGFEKCPTCESTVPFDDLMSARCDRGHLFKRCAATFTMINDPNSRVCGLCSREYISLKMVIEEEERTAELRAKDGFDTAGQPTLLRVLFDAVDTCVFCGGGFYDKETRFKEDHRLMN